MTIFSEIYGAYYRIASRLLGLGSVKDSDVYDVIREDGFRDSALFLPQKLLPQPDGSDWGLFERGEDGLLHAIVGEPPRVLSRLQKMWLKAKLADPRMRLFLCDDVLQSLSVRLSDVPPLYRNEYFRYFDRFSDGDDFGSEHYRENFQTVLKAIKERRMLKIGFTSGHDRRMSRLCLPFKLEYSEKNDKFRVYCHDIKGGKIVGGGLINLGRIDNIAPDDIYSGETPSEDDFFRRIRAKQPIRVYVSPERNAVERFLNEFAEYEKRVDRDLENGGCTVDLYYDSQDETELLILLLGFGAAVEILSPKSVRKQAAERVQKQVRLLEEGENELQPQ